ncbi:MAG: DNA polymerase I [Ichthyobacteriaceae bacterium]|nr:DNA polymerase I [Ichthyobacteriaceae bacterium]
MNNNKKLFLLDAFALIYRGYFAFAKNPRISSKGFDTSAVLGFTNTLVDLLRREKPTHIAVVFDTSVPTFRHIEYPEYKAQRDAMPEGIQVALPIIHEILDAFKIPQLYANGYEADDVIGTLAKKAEKEGFTTYMMTPDKDYAQLITENIFMYRPARMGNGIEIWGIPEVQAKFEVENVEQVIDYLGMMGDAVDNIPGLPGVGDKTAKKFIKAYGSMENLFEHTHELKGKMKEKVEQSKELGLLSKKLATIALDAPVDFVAEDMVMENPNMEELGKVFAEMEFRRLLNTVQSIFGTEITNIPEEPKNTATLSKKNTNTDTESFPTDLFSVPDTETTQTSGFNSLENTDHYYQLVDNYASRKLLLEKLLKQKSVCFDTETTSLDTFEAELVGIAFAWEKHKGYYLAIAEGEAESILEEFKPFFENKEIEKIGQNLKYDLKVLANTINNTKVEGPFFDTMIAHYLINPDMRHNMDILSETYLNYAPMPIENLIGKKGKNQKTMRSVSLINQTEYAVEDADITLQLKSIFIEKLKEAGTYKLFKDIEIPLVEVLTTMEVEGINLDVESLKTLSIDLAEEVTIIEKKVYESAGETFNMSSPKQIGEILFGKLELVAKPKKTKTGQYQTSEAILSKLASKHEIIRDILEYRSVVKLKSTYVDALPKEIKKSTGRVHTTYSQTTAATGRLSSTSPNLQNIPVRTERGKLIRKAFIPRDENHILLAADYSQIELRLIAEMSKDPQMVKSFKNNEDIHAATAAKIFNVPLNEVTREQRGNAKTVNFGIIYGVSAFGLSEQTNLSRKESATLIEAYYENYSELKGYMDKQINFARENGYVETIFGRRRYLNDINSRNAMVRSAAERNAINAPIQGSAADIIKVAMINILKRLDEKGLKSKMLLQVHDELVFDVPKDEIEILKPIIKYEMENAVKTEIPLTVDMGEGNNWLEAH